VDIHAAIRSRCSTRRYTDQPVAERVLEHLLSLATTADHLCRPGVRVALVSGRERVACILARYAGVYGLVRGAPYLLAGVLSQDVDLARLDLGYVLEQVVLRAAQEGLSTCWMTGSYHPDRAAEVMRMRPGEAVGAVIALGHPRQDRRARLHDGAIRRLVAAHRRRPLEEIVFAARWGERWTPGGADPALVTLLECARWAPSARNRQPWRFVVRPGELALALVESAPIDAGIAMAHVALAAYPGRPRRWVVRWGDPALAAALDLPHTVVPVGTFSL
jgi:nitroreductase